MVGARPVHFAAAAPAPEVSAADNNPDLHPHIGTCLDRPADLKHFVKINAVCLGPGETFAAELEQYPFIFWLQFQHSYSVSLILHDGLYKVKHFIAKYSYSCQLPSGRDSSEKSFSSSHKNSRPTSLQLAAEHSFPFGEQRIILICFL
jgi:hypothetical protein